MGVDYFNCEVCGEIYCDCVPCGQCACGASMCGECHDDAKGKWGASSDDEWDSLKCPVCQGTALTPEAKLFAIAEIWKKYKAYLMDKYPAPDGERWAFSCEFHKEIDGILKEDKQ